jgi:hypothetical protein
MGLAILATITSVICTLLGYATFRLHYPDMFSEKCYKNLRTVHFSTNIFLTAIMVTLLIIFAIGNDNEKANLSASVVCGLQIVFIISYSMVLTIIGHRRKKQ